MRSPIAECMNESYWMREQRNLPARRSMSEGASKILQTAEAKPRNRRRRRTYRKFRSLPRLPRNVKSATSLERVFGEQCGKDEPNELI